MVHYDILYLIYCLTSVEPLSDLPRYSGIEPNHLAAFVYRLTRFDWSIILGKHRICSMEIVSCLEQYYWGFYLQFSTLLAPRAPWLEKWRSWTSLLLSFQLYTSQRLCCLLPGIRKVSCIWLRTTPSQLWWVRREVEKQPNFPNIWIKQVGVKMAKLLPWRKWVPKKSTFDVFYKSSSILTTIFSLAE